jgi:hypothetical protein
VCRTLKTLKQEEKYKRDYPFHLCYTEVKIGSLKGDARRITAAEIKLCRKTTGYTLQNNRRDCQGFKYNPRFGQNTELQNKLDTTCKRNST